MLILACKILNSDGGQFHEFQIFILIFDRTDTSAATKPGTLPTINEDLTTPKGLLSKFKQGNNVMLQLFQQTLDSFKKI
ncbi:hypothetical protein ACOSP7_030105 [Xanthoceras sorbifolium]